MAIEGKIKTLFSDESKTEVVFPRTKTSAVSNSDNVGLDALLNQMDTKINSKASESFVTNKIAEAQLAGSDNNVDLSGYATKDDLDAIDFPVDSINGKTGSVSLSAGDVGAAVGMSMITSADATTASGMYRIQGASDVPAPCDYGQLVVVHGGADTIAQIAFDYIASKMWIRTGAPAVVGGGSVWGSWRRVITEDSFSYSNGTLTISI